MYGRQATAKYRFGLVSKLRFNSRSKNIIFKEYMDITGYKECSVLLTFYLPKPENIYFDIHLETVDLITAIRTALHAIVQ